MKELNQKPLREAMLIYAPELAEDYKSFVRNTFNNMKRDLGDNLVGIYNDWRWANTFHSISANLKRTCPPAVYSYQEVIKYPYIIAEEDLEINAKTYGERIALEWFNKMLTKLVDIDDVIVSEPNNGGNITINGSRCNNNIYIEQQRIINVSKLGTVFHQFPARIYVNGKFYSEAGYKKLFAHDQIK